MFHIMFSMLHSLKGEDQLLENFKDAVTLNEEKPVNFQVEPFDEQKER